MYYLNISDVEFTNKNVLVNDKVELVRMVKRLNYSIYQYKNRRYKRILNSNIYYNIRNSMSNYDVILIELYIQNELMKEIIVKNKGVEIYRLQASKFTEDVIDLGIKINNNEIILFDNVFNLISNFMPRSIYRKLNHKIIGDVYIAKKDNLFVALQNYIRRFNYFNYDLILEDTDVNKEVIKFALRNEFIKEIDSNIYAINKKSLTINANDVKLYKVLIKLGYDINFTGISFLITGKSIHVPENSYMIIREGDYFKLKIKEGRKVLKMLNKKFKTEDLAKEFMYFYLKIRNVSPELSNIFLKQLPNKIDTNEYIKEFTHRGKIKKETL